MSPFSICMDRILASEGGYTPAVPSDPGGETNFGISKRSYPGVDIKALTREAAIEIYRADFWTAIRGAELPLAIAFPLLDFAVNSGPVPAIKALQAALRVKADGILGSVTMASIPDGDGSALAALVMRMTAQRLRFMASLANWGPNSRGWVSRIAENLDDSAIDIS